MWKGGMSLPRPTASLAMTPGTEERWQAAACAAELTAPIMKRPIPRKCASACGPATSPSCARAQAAAKPRPLPQGKPMNLRSKALKPTPPSVLSPPLAIPLALRFTTVNRSGCARRAVGRHAPAIGPWILRSASGGEETSFDQPSAFAAALRQAMSEARDIELLFAIWEQNVETVRALNRSLKQHSLPRSGIAPQLVAHLKHCAVALVKPENRSKEQLAATSDQRTHNGAGAKIDKSVLTISEPKRIRSKEHLRFVAQQPCLICGRSPSHAHHIRFAQSRGLGLKVSDEFTVPLCAIHHQQNHATGNERLWWQEHKIDPLAVALCLWRESQHLPAPDNKSLDGSGP